MAILLVCGVNITEEQVLQLAPDTSSLKAGQQLATTSKWVKRHVHEKAIWGHCQGSGKEPYKTMIDRVNLAFKCSCPSRKFPCKHGIALGLLYAKNPGDFETETILAEQVEEWIGKRENKAEVKKEKEDKPVDEAAQKKRVEAREKKVNNGIDELRTWIKDVVRTGIVNVPQQAHNFTSTISARMIDAQASGLATLTKSLMAVDFYNEGWEKTFLKKLSKIYLLTEGYKNLNSLPPLLAQDIRTLVGWTVAKEEVLAGDTVSDDWSVLSVATEDDDKITTERIWLYGHNSKRFALLLNFYAGGQSPQHTISSGTIIRAELAFYPSTVPLRAIIKEQTAVAPFISLTGSESFMLVAEEITKSLSALPFVEKIPVLLSSIKISTDNKKWVLTDAANLSYSLNNDEGECWKALSISKGVPFSAFAIYENEKFTILSMWNTSDFYPLV